MTHRVFIGVFGFLRLPPLVPIEVTDLLLIALQNPQISVGLMGFH